LKIFKDATLFFSRGTPNIATVIPAMDHIDKVLATTSDDSRQYSLPIRAALVIGKNAINRYYNKTDHSETYRIAMSTYYPSIYFFVLFTFNLVVLHPRHKLAYFKAQDWDESWVEAAYNILRDEYDRSYALDRDSDDDYIAVGSVDTVSLLFFFFHFF
jgi:hypothetical protein